MSRLLCAAVFCSWLSGGCALTFDSVYLIGGNKTTERETLLKPTGNAEQTVELEMTALPDDTFELACHQRTRNVERKLHVSKRYRRQGGFDRGTYTGAAVLDALVGGTIAVIVGAACTGEDPKLSCLNLVYAAPFAADLGWAMIRRATAKPKILIGRREIDVGVGLSESAKAEQEVGCDGVESVWLGTTELAGNGRRVDRETSTSLEVSIEPTRDDGAPVRGVVRLSDAAKSAWVETNAALFAVNRDGTVTPIEVDRCRYLASTSLPAEARGKLYKAPNACPQPTPASTQSATH